MPDTYEHEHAVMEAQRNESADAWDRGAPMDEAERRLYENGFTSGWVRRGPLAAGDAALSRACDLLSTCVGLLMSQRAKIGYAGNSVIADTISEAVTFLKAWPEKLPAQPARSPTSAVDVAARICRAIAELPDRDSPADWPQAMLVTHEELRTIVEAELMTAAPAAVERESTALCQAARDVLEERARQTSAEGYAPEHDDEHWAGDLVRAAVSYAWPTYPSTYGDPDKEDGHQPYKWCPQLWPWDQSDWKPRGKRRNLVRAAALLIADIERLDRAAARCGSNKESRGNHG